MFFYSSVQVNPRILNWGSLHIVYKAKFEPTIKVDAINMMDYGVMNGAKVLEAALKMMEG
ncbi:phosphotransferase system lactose/cellobiose-specific IIB subunit [Streptococcus suis JS14]|nr:phosphotransferase system lactose/cellobiose-specific IIB subunit [Streptococcus suis JS14]MBS7928307.1 hypothetical protein [Streptococcus suis]MBS8092083.1 hypothetical protein [Streptococcus suis]MYZ58105.1 hypothetical protein [Streptococcus suis]